LHQRFSRLRGANGYSAGSNGDPAAGQKISPQKRFLFFSGFF
jgi:hypothetical protein